MADTQETFVSFTELVRRLPRKPGGRKLGVAALYRWSNANRGHFGVVLERFYEGGVAGTTWEAWSRFNAAVTERRRPANIRPRPPSQAELDADLRRCDAILDAAGV